MGLKQIFGVNQPFVDISVLFVADLSQLPPVLNKPAYKNPKTSPSSDLALSEPWNLFEIFRLTKAMRQNDDIHKRTGRSAGKIRMVWWTTTGGRVIVGVAIADSTNLPLLIKSIHYVTCYPLRCIEQ